MKKFPRPDFKASNFHQTLIVAWVLAFIGGFFEIYTFTQHGEIFANAQTLNFVFAIIGSLDKTLGIGIHPLNNLIPLLSFIVASFVFAFLQNFFEEKDQWWRIYVIGLELGILIGIGFIKSGEQNILVGSLIGAICAIQFKSFNVFKGSNVATTWMTNNMVNVGVESYEAIFGKRGRKKHLNKLILLLSIIFFFAVGAICCAFVVHKSILGARSIWICAGLLLFIFMFYLVLIIISKRKNIIHK